MNTIAIIILAPFLWKLLYLVLGIGALALIIWLVKRYIAPIPPEALTFIAIVVVIIAAIVLLVGCTLTPEQTQGYINAGHSAIRGGLQDYKTIKDIQSP